VTRVLFWGDAGHTGFGTVTWDLGTRLIARGLDVRFLSMNVNWEPIAHPIGERTWAIDRADQGKLLSVVTQGFPDGWKADAMILLGDYRAAAITVMHTHPQLTEAFRTTPTFHYIPVEGHDLPPAWAATWSVVRPVAMSEFGADQLAKILPYRPPVVYHGVNTEDFYPVAPNRPGYWKGKPITSKDAAKQALQAIHGAIYALRTDRHMPRKDTNRLIRAMVPAMEAVPELHLVLHCRPYDEGGHLPDTLSKYGPDILKRIILTNSHDSYRGLTRADLNVLYNASDIYVTTGAEGFGLTPAEALATGCPVVALDYSTLPEIVGPAGVLVPPAHFVDNPYDHYWAAVNEAKFTEAVIRLCRKPQERRALGSKGPRHITETFSWDRAAELFAGLIEGTTMAEVAA
jgi:glycosyltransferase involved in cell wall biosynthesis